MVSYSSKPLTSQEQICSTPAELRSTQRPRLSTVQYRPADHREVLRELPNHLRRRNTTLGRRYQQSISVLLSPWIILFLRRLSQRSAVIPGYEVLIPIQQCNSTTLLIPIWNVYYLGSFQGPELDMLDEHLFSCIDCCKRLRAIEDAENHVLSVGTADKQSHRFCDRTQWPEPDRWISWRLETYGRLAELWSSISAPSAGLKSPKMGRIGCNS